MADAEVVYDWNQVPGDPAGGVVLGGVVLGASGLLPEIYRNLHSLLADIIAVQYTWFKKMLVSSLLFHVARCSSMLIRTEITRMVTAGI